MFLNGLLGILPSLDLPKHGTQPATDATPSIGTPMLISTPPQFPARPTDGHKGTFGRVLIIAGSRGMSGAACLAGVSALRGGAGLVYIAVPADIQPVVASYEPSYLTIPLPSCSESGQFLESAVANIQQASVTKDAIAIGPGMGTERGARAVMEAVWMTCPQPVVVDADALNVLAMDHSLLQRHQTSHVGPRILTPHPGEFARLINASMADVATRRRELALEFAATYGCVLLLKGPQTLVTDGKQLAVNSTGNSGMATGGSGDVLTGLIAALLAQGLSPFDAARTGAYWHGLAGDLAANEVSQPCLIASDLPRYLGRAWLAANTQ